MYTLPSDIYELFDAYQGKDDNNNRFVMTPVKHQPPFQKINDSPLNHLHLSRSENTGQLMVQSALLQVN